MSWCKSDHGHLFSALHDTELDSISSCSPWGNFVLFFGTEILLWECLRPSPGVQISTGEFQFEGVTIQWVGGAVVPWLLRSTPDRAGRGHCVVFLAKHLTFTLPLSTQV